MSIDNQQSAGLVKYFRHDKDGVREVTAEEAAQWKANPPPTTSATFGTGAAETLARIQFNHVGATQAFFQRLADEMRKPSYGEQSREFGKALLLRAQEANLYTPEHT